MGPSGDQNSVVRAGPFGYPNWQLTVGIGTFEQGPELRRRIGATSSLPSPADIDNLLRINDYAQFRAALENIHNNVHSWIGGSMGGGTSPNDPIFFLNHTNVDRLWAQWQSLHPQVPQYPFNNANQPMNMENMLPTVTPNQVLNNSALGYTYDTFQALRMPSPQPTRVSPAPMQQMTPSPQLFPTDAFAPFRISPTPQQQGFPVFQPQNQFSGPVSSSNMSTMPGMGGMNNMNMGGMNMSGMNMNMNSSQQMQRSPTRFM
jgi:hypothetical protein